MKYVNEKDLKEFIDRLPELQINPPTVHLMMLAVRSRKAKEILGKKIHDLVVEREIIRKIPDWRTRYFNSVYNLSVLQHEGRYEVQGLMAPAEAMGIFATLSPRNVMGASADLFSDNIRLLYRPDDSQRAELSKIGSRYFGCLHRHKDRTTNFVTADLDTDDPVIFKEVKDALSVIPFYMVTETSRGFHIIMNITKQEDAKVFYGQNGLMQQLGLKYTKYGLEWQKDSQEPVAGTHYYKKGGKDHFVKILQ